MPSAHHAPRLWPFLVLALIPGLAYGWALWRGFPGALLNPTGSVVVRDYLNLWAGGGLALAGQLDIVFDPAAYQVWLQGVFGPALDLHTWSYPPPMLLLALPFGLLPLLPGFVVWTIATLALLAGVLRAAGLGHWVIAAIAFSPAALENALAGQNGALTAACLAGGLLLAPRRPVLAGALLGLLVLKPQLGLLVPICLLAAGLWRAIGATAGFALAWCLASLLVFGPEAWTGFLARTTPFMTALMQAPIERGFQMGMPAPFIAARAAGAGLALAYGVQAAVSVGCFALAWLAWRRGSGTAAVALALLLAPLATPYAHSYDMVCTAVGVALLAVQAPGALATRALALAWLWPGVAFAVGVLLAPGLGPLAMAPAVLVAARLALGAPPGAAKKIRTSTGFPPPAPQAGASTIPPWPHSG